MESPVITSQQQDAPQFLSESPQLSIIVPTYHEAENLPLLVHEVAAALQPVMHSWEIIIVDDNSQDGTVDVCQTLQTEGFPLRLVVRTNARGLSSAVVEGFAHAQAPILLVMDADLSHPATIIPQMYRAIWEGAEFASGSRYVPGGGTDDKWSWYRWLNSKVAVWLARPLVSLQDPSTGFFALPRSLLQRCPPLSPIGYKIALEILVKSGAKNLREIPIVFRTRRLGHSKLQLKQQLLYLRHLCSLYKFKFFPVPAQVMTTELALFPQSPPHPRQEKGR
jgi:dolichol-phosphate mannosyltransferase